MTTPLPPDGHPLVLHQLLKDGPTPDAIRAAAKLTGRSTRTIRRWVKRGGIPTHARPRYEATEADLLAFVECRGRLRSAYSQRLAEAPDLPSRRSWERAVHRALRPDQFALARDGENGRRAHTTYLRWEPEHRNAVWEADHKELDVWVIPNKGHKPARPWITAYIDGRTRAITGYVLSLTPNTAAVLAGLRQSVLLDEEIGPFGGAPAQLRYDNGREWLSDAFGHALQALGIVAVPVAPYAPTEKGKVERLFGTLVTEFLSQLPGYLRAPRRADGMPYGGQPALLTLRELSVELRKWVRHYNTERPHAALAGATPLQRWSADPTPLRLIDAEQLRWLLMPPVTRKMGKDGIHFQGLTYFAPGLTGLVGETLEIRYTPNDARRIEVFRDGQWLGTAIPTDVLSPEERRRVQRARNESRIRVDALRRKAHRAARLRVAPLTGDEPVEDVRVVSPADALTGSRGKSRLARVRKASLKLLNLDDEASE